MLKKVVIIITLIAFMCNVISCAYVPTFVKPLDKKEIGRKHSYRISKPVKAHLHDGCVVIYRAGFEAVADTIVTTGRKYDITRHNPELAARIPLEQVASLEYYTASFDFFAFLMSVPGTLLSILILGLILNPPNVQMG